MVQRLMRSGKGAMRRRGMGWRWWVLLHQGMMVMQSLIPLMHQRLVQHVPSLRRWGWQTGWQSCSLQMLLQSIRVDLSYRVSRPLVEVLDGRGGGSRTAALRVSVIGEERTSVQSQADRVVGTPDQRRLERRELDVASSTGSLTQCQVLGSALSPASRAATKTTAKDKEGNVRSQRPAVDREGRYNQSGVSWGREQQGSSGTGRAVDTKD